MLYNLEPDRSVTGGAWYSDQDFESEFVEVLNQQCFKYLEQKVGTCPLHIALKYFSRLINYCINKYYSFTALIFNTFLFTALTHVLDLLHK